MAKLDRTYAILVVDDDRNINKLISDTLNLEKIYEVTPVLNGEACLKYIRENIPDLILLDIQMPGIDGIETLKKIKEYDPRITVVMMSAHGSIEKAVKSMKLGSYDFISKPFDRDRLRITVNNALITSSLEQQGRELRSELKQIHKFETIIGPSGVMNAVFTA